jgi:general secretion pathway protein J
MLRSRLRNVGFTLVELLVALSVMAILSVLSWRGLDSMTRTQAQTRQYSDELLILQTGLAQWNTDLDALVQPSATPGVQPGPLDWNGQVLRLIRDSAPSGTGWRIVAWTRRDEQGTSQWLRWQSAVLRTQGELQTAWQQAGLWAQGANAETRTNEVAITPLAQWQIFYFRGGAWSNPLSSDRITATPSATLQPGLVSGSNIPDGVRLVLTLPAGRALSGILTRDWIRPTVGGEKS